MKYGKILEERTLPQWTPYNVDYNELKYLIKVNTTRDKAQAIVIPGQVDSNLIKFENQFYAELCNQHDRVDLFVKSKSDELNRRLREHQRRSIDLIARCNNAPEGSISLRRRERFSRMESKVMSCGDDIRKLEKFVENQKTAFRKILKKYKKWTGSAALGPRIIEDVLSNPRSFVNSDFSYLNVQCSNLLSLLRSSTPLHSGPTSPGSHSRRSSQAEARRPVDTARGDPEQERPQQVYWNEYDHGSEAGDGDEPYTLYVDPDADDSFPGKKTMTYVFNQAKVPFTKMKGWLSPHGSVDERRPLVTSQNGHISNYFTSHASSTLGTDTDIEDDNSTSEFPAGYETHYAFPSIADQKLQRQRERVLFHSTIGCFVASFVLLLVAGILIATGRHRLRVEVDAGVTVGVVAALFFATMGLSIMLCRFQRCGVVQRIFVLFTFVAVCCLSGILLVMVMGNTAGV